ncbi:MAG TPA: maleylpyruvate isomerase N-terminal domain-containing protein [Candidatus Limnocylindria bacterium]
MSKAEFLAGVRAARTELEHVLASRDERTLAETMLPGQRWTSKDLLAHLIGYDVAVRTAIANVRAGRTWTWPWTTPRFDAWNESQVAPRRSRTYQTVRAELDTSRAGLLAELERWPDDAGPFGPATWDQTKSPISWLGPHEREHAEMIAKL